MIEGKRRGGGRGQDRRAGNGARALLGALPAKLEVLPLEKKMSDSSRARALALQRTKLSMEFLDREVAPNLRVFLSQRV